MGRYGMKKNDVNKMRRKLAKHVAAKTDMRRAPVIPAPPTNFRVIEKDMLSVTLGWKFPGEVLLGVVVNGRQYSDLYNGFAKQFKVEQLIPNKMYIFRVQSIVNNVLSREVRLNVKLDAIPPPFSFLQGATADSSLQLVWVPADFSDPFHEYQNRVDWLNTEIGQWVTIYTGTGIECYHTGLKPLKNYKYRLRTETTDQSSASTWRTLNARTGPQPDGTLILRATIDPQCEGECYPGYAVTTVNGKLPKPLEFPYETQYEIQGGTFICHLEIPCDSHSGCFVENNDARVKVVPYQTALYTFQIAPLVVHG